MHPSRIQLILLMTLIPLSGGCTPHQSPASKLTEAKIPPQPSPSAQSDPEKVRSADFSILFVGNSHTYMHNLPNIIAEMIRFLHPDKTVYSHTISVGFLEDVARDPQCRQELETRDWKFVVLQAQKESKSGRYQYSTQEGIDIAKVAKSRGVKVLFYSEWGLRDVPGHGPRIEKVYQEMAVAAGGQVAPVGRAWDLALADRPELPLYASDGNHQSVLGAFLTACVLAGRLANQSTESLASFPYLAADESDRKFLADCAAKTLAAMNHNPEKK